MLANEHSSVLIKLYLKKIGGDYSFPSSTLENIGEHPCKTSREASRWNSVPLATQGHLSLASFLLVILSKVLLRDCLVSFLAWHPHLTPASPHLPALGL